jgi:glycine/D-amino acid oxidase-like deaminating enzyme
MKRVAVLGGGITGVTTAYALAKRGVGVTLSSATATRPWKLRMRTAGNCPHRTRKCGTTRRRL